MSGSSSRSPYRSSSQSPRPRSSSTAGRIGDDATPAVPAGSGRERLAIRFLAGQQPPPRPTSAAGGGPTPSGYSRQRAISTHVPSSSSSHSRRPYVPAPSRLSGASHLPQAAMVPGLPDPRGRSYHLEVVQHPERSAEYASAVLSRLPLAPPPVVQLTIRDHMGAPVNPDTELPFLVAHLSLCSEDGTPLDMDFPGLQPAQSRLLYGTLVSSAQTLRNLQGSVGSYFIFPDVSVRQRGRYALRISLMRLPRQVLRIALYGGNPAVAAGAPVTTLTYVYTRVFDIVSQTNYVAPQLTPLTQYFIRQGARMYAFESSIASHNLS
ncbi:hypothetical protein SCHPADRAFT_820573 [Schizopora paradoxa]|uniref:Velvet domain-containing protein n=1 Tax=Schizopora paradoxa TaxID=27342 RepID=A0A0H2S8K9_9AGAM|nr:hypothetical protein SCHPADRAFT_820573 [Schizopora paradoxa]